MEEINRLQAALSPYLSWHGARLKFLALLLVALMRVRTVNRSELAVAFASRAKAESSEKRLKRFFTKFEFETDEIDLLHESGERREVIVENSCEQVKTQAKSPSPIPVSAREDAEALQTTKAMLDSNPNRGQSLIRVLLLNRQRASRWLALRQDGQRMMVGQSLISTISQTPERGGQASPTAFPQRQVVGSSRCSRHGNKPTRFPIDDDLSFQSMSPLLKTLS